MTIDAIGREIEAYLQSLIRAQDPGVPSALRPQHSRVMVTVKDRRTGRKKRKDASAESLNPIETSFVIEFDPENGESLLEPGRQERSRPRNTVADTRMMDVINAVCATEREGRAFISLIWFRENRLTGYAWAAEPAARQQTIAEAIKAGVLEVRKIPNPKNPQYPVSTIALNRMHPLVQEALRAGAAQSMFEPAVIAGGPLSPTILEDRR